VKPLRFCFCNKTSDILHISTKSAKFILCFSVKVVSLHWKLESKKMVTTQLNPAQLNVLSLMSYIDTEQEQEELQGILLKFYQQKLDRELLQFQKDNNVTQQTLDEWACKHERTPY